MKKRYITLLAFCIFCAALSIPEIVYKNEGKSQSIGSVRDGSLQNAWLWPYQGENFRYFSLGSYYLGNNGYLHSDLYSIISDAYKECESTCPGIKFRLMECSDKHGGKLLIHRTHQNGTSADFMVPKKNSKKQVKRWDRLGFLHYLLEFDEKGHLKLEKNIEIDFESMAKHIIAIHDASAEHGWRIRKVIFKINLQDELMKSSHGEELRKRDIYFVKSLTPIVDKVHDDHYHIDFVEI